MFAFCHNRVTSINSFPENNYKRWVKYKKQIIECIRSNPGDPGSRGQDHRNAPRWTWQCPLLFLLSYLPFPRGTGHRLSKVSNSAPPGRQWLKFRLTKNVIVGKAKILGKKGNNREVGTLLFPQSKWHNESCFGLGSGEGGWAGGEGRAEKLGTK